MRDETARPRLKVSAGSATPDDDSTYQRLSEDPLPTDSGGVKHRLINEATILS